MLKTGKRKIRDTNQVINVSVKLPSDLHLKLVGLASDERRSLAQQVIVLLEKGVSEHEPRGIGTVVCMGSDGSGPGRITA